MRTTITATLTAAMALCVGAALSPAAAWDLAGKKSLVLHTRDGKDIALGSVTFQPDGDKTKFSLDLDQSKLKEFFLSMRQFKCVEGAEIQCVVPYPYTNPRTVSANDLAWLEQDLLFMWKRPNDYGAQMQNGLYYAMKVTDHGIVGTPQAIDLDKIASPPDDLTVPPYAPADRDDIGKGARWIESLRIE